MIVCPLMAINAFHMTTPAVHITSTAAAYVASTSWTPAGALRCPAERRFAHSAHQGIASGNFDDHSLTGEVREMRMGGGGVDSNN